MMVIDDVVSILGAEDHRNHMIAKKLFAFFGLHLPPAFTLLGNFTHSDGDLGWTQIRNRDRFKNWFSNSNHGLLLACCCLKINLCPMGNAVRAPASSSP